MSPRDVTTIELNAGRELLPAQFELATSSAWIRTIVGGYGSGKTMGAAIAFIANCLLNPYDSTVHLSDRPQSMVVGLTRGVMRDSAQKALRQLLPRGFIQEERKAENIWVLINGHEVLFKTAAGAIEGNNLCALWLDEAHQLEPELWANLQARVRDPRARQLLILVSGLPEFGWLQDAFGKQEHYADPERCIIHCSTLDNHNLPPQVVAQLRSSVGASEADAYLHGKWRQAQDAVFYGFAPARNVIRDVGDKHATTHLTLDVGNRGAILLFQIRQKRFKNLVNGQWVEKLGPALHFVDELLPENISTEEACRIAKGRGWAIRNEDQARAASASGRTVEPSYVFMDPRSNIDQMEAVRRTFGNVRVIVKRRGMQGYDVDEGHRAVNAAFADVDGNVRLTISDQLPQEKRSLRTSLPKVRRRADGDGMIKDNLTDHVADALRYPVVHLLPLRTNQVLVTRAA